MAIPALGILAGRREKDLGAYFLGGRAIPWWLVWLSILAAEISAATFLGVPAFAFGHDWTYLQNVLGTILARIVVAFLFLRPYFDLQVTTVYGYLEKRFGPRTRNGASCVFLVSRILASGVRLYVGALLLESVVGLPVAWGIPLIAGVTCVYTLAGGIKAVVATDSIQVLLMFVGAIAAGCVLLSRLWPDLGAPPMKVLDTSLDFQTKNPTLWGGLVGGLFITLASHGTDQDIVQRLLTAKDVRSSRRALIASGILDIPIVVVFLGIGSLLRVYFERFPDPARPADENAVFPYFIAHGLPHGLAGLVIAGVLSVVMGSLSAAMNALASTAILDLWKPYIGKSSTDAEDVRAARLATLVMACLLTFVAWGTMSFEKMNLIDLAMKAIGLTYGALLGVFLRGFLTRGRGDTANLLAMACSIGTVLALARWTPIHWNWFVPIGAVVTFTVGAVASRRIPR